MTSPHTDPMVIYTQMKKSCIAKHLAGSYDGHLRHHSRHLCQRRGVKVFVLKATVIIKIKAVWLKFCLTLRHEMVEASTKGTKQAAIRCVERMGAFGLFNSAVQSSGLLLLLCIEALQNLVFAVAYHCCQNLCPTMSV